MLVIYNIATFSQGKCVTMLMWNIKGQCKCSEMHPEYFVKGYQQLNYIVMQFKMSSRVFQLSLTSQPGVHQCWMSIILLFLCFWTVQIWQVEPGCCECCEIAAKLQLSEAFLSAHCIFTGLQDNIHELQLLQFIYIMLHSWITALSTTARF